MRAISSVLPRINSTAINKLESNLRNNKIKILSDQKKKNLPDRKFKKINKKKEEKPCFLWDDRNQRERNEHRERLAKSDSFRAFEKKNENEFVDFCNKLPREDLNWNGNSRVQFLAFSGERKGF